MANLGEKTAPCAVFSPKFAMCRRRRHEPVRDVSPTDLAVSDLDGREQTDYDANPCPGARRRRAGAPRRAPRRARGLGRAVLRLSTEVVLPTRGRAVQGTTSRQEDDLASTPPAPAPASVTRSSGRRRGAFRGPQP